VVLLATQQVSPLAVTALRFGRQISLLARLHWTIRKLLLVSVSVRVVAGFVMPTFRKPRKVGQPILWWRISQRRTNQRWANPQPTVLVMPARSKP